MSETNDNNLRKEKGIVLLEYETYTIREGVIKGYIPKKKYRLKLIVKESFRKSLKGSIRRGLVVESVMKSVFVNITSINKLNQKSETRRLVFHSRYSERID